MTLQTPPTRAQIAEFVAKAEAYEKANPDHCVPYRFPFILPAGWLCADRWENDARYASSAGLRVLCTSAREQDGKHWLHISLSYVNRLPSYEDMTACKKLFVGAHRTAYQVFPDESNHINHHSFCLHLWCCMDGPVTPDFTHGIGTI